MILNTTQKAAIAAIKRKQKDGGDIVLAVVVGGVLTVICAKEPESAQRVLDGLTGGKPLEAAVKEMRRRARGRCIEYHDAEEILREFYGLDEPLETTEEADEDELV